MTRVPAAAARSTRCAMAGKIFALRTLLIIFITFLFLSCDLFLDVNIDNSGNFWAINYLTKKNYRVKAELFAEGRYCNVWVERGSRVSKAQAKTVADRYDNKIHRSMINVFGIENPSFDGRTFHDIMEVADYLGDGDGKLCILLMDIKDGYKTGVNESFVAGYFWSGNFYDLQGSNKCDMIYLDTYPGMGISGKNIENVFTTLAHEMQHMMNRVTRIVLSPSGSIFAAPMDTWIDEGLSSAAEYIVNDGEHSKDRIDWYNENGDSKVKIKGLIDQGNNFFVWENHENENPYAVLDDYATVYLFFQWLRIQNGADVYRNIISSNNNDYHAIEEATGEKWDMLLKNWMAANYINSSTGVHGYKGEIQITTHTVIAGQMEISLYPGEGVYSLTNASDTMPTKGVNIRYTGLDKTAGVNDGIVFNAGRLLTYNINTKLYGLDGVAEIGLTTGKAANVNITPGRSAVPSYSGPYRIGAGDILSRNGKNKDTSWDFQDK
jgi:hypothetical protein